MRIILLLLLSLRAYAAGRTCVSAVSGDWATAGTWSNCGGGSPGDGDIAKITNLHTVHISTHVTVGLSQTATTAAMLNSTTLSAAIASTGQTAITVASAANIVNGQYLMLLAEGANTMEIVAVSCSGACTTSLTIVRAQLGTAASLHANAAVVDVGSVPAISGTGSNYFGGNGTGILVIDDGGWLTYRGNVEQCNAIWTVGKDAILEHDSSVQGGTAHYQWIIGNNLFPDTAKLQIRGTLGHRTLIRKATSSAYSGGFQKFATIQGSGQYDWEYVTVDSCGGPATPCAEATAHNGASTIARCDHCLITNSGYIGATSFQEVGHVAKITNTTVTATTDAAVRTIRVTFTSVGSVILDTIYTDGQIALGGANNDVAAGTHIRNVIVRMITNHNGIDMGGASFQVGEFDRVMKITDVLNSAGGVYAYAPGGTLTRLMGLNDASSNPYFFHGPHGVTGGTDVVDGAWLENKGGGGDGDAFGSAVNAGSFTLRNAVIPCPLDNGIAMSLENMPTTSLHTWSIQNTTYCGKDDGAGSARGFGFELTGTAPAGMVSSVKNNIVFCATAGCAGYLLHQGPTGTPATGSYQGVDYNWAWNLTTGPYLKAVLWSSASAYVVGNRVQYSDGHSYRSIQNGTNKIPPSQPTFWTLTDDEYANPNPPGAHDSSGDPQFVQQRHFLDWGQLLKPSISTWSDIVAEFAKMNDDVGYDARFTILNAYDWLRDGYRPRNPAVMNAGDTGRRVGAMDAYGTPSLVVGPAKIVGPTVIK